MPSPVTAASSSRSTSTSCPVSPGTPSAAILVANLFNTVQPLIRYRIEDRFIRRPDAADHGHLRSKGDRPRSRATVTSPSTRW